MEYKMPNGDNLTIRHTPRTIPGGARSRWGLPYQRLPGAQTNLTPESMLEQEIQTGRQAIQNKYALQWKEVNRSRRFIGAAKSQRMLRDIDTRAKQEMLQFNQQAQAQLTQLRNIDRLAEQGAINNPEQIKAREIFGPDIAKSMYPTPEKEQPIERQIDTLDLHAYKIEDRLAQFRTVERGPWDEKWFARKTWFGWPFPKEKKKLITQIYDRTISVEDEKGEITMGGYRPATEEEIRGQKLAEEQLKDVKQRISRLRTKYFEQPDISQRIVQPDIRSGFDAGVIKSIKPQRRPRQLKARDPLGLRP